MRENAIARQDHSDVGLFLMPPNDDITLAVLLQHMQGMEQRLMNVIQEVEKKLTTRIDAVDNKLTKRMDVLERKIDFISVQIGNIDKRLDDVEVIQIPKLKKAVGIQ